MKGTRLQPSAHTHEDFCIWVAVTQRLISPGRSKWKWDAMEYLAADRRDADIMQALGSIHISTGGDYSEAAIAGRVRMLQGFMAFPHALGFAWMPERIAVMRERP